MSRRRIAFRLAAAVAAAVVTSGCITQPMDSSALEAVTEDLGATAAPLDDEQARRLESDAREVGLRHSGEDQTSDKVVWTKPRTHYRNGDDKGGLVRTGTAEAPLGGDGADGGSTSRSGGGDGAGDDGQSDIDRGGSAGNGDADDGESGNATQPGSDHGRGGGGTDRRKMGDRAGAGDAGDDDTDAPDDKQTFDEQPPPSAPAFQAIATAGDPEDDATGQSPGYADVRQLLIESDGKRARVTVAVARLVPSTLQEGEVQGLGVDLYRSSGRESDYQLFADGDDTGWTAFLQTPDGLVEYPGTFGIGGRVFVFEVPWSSLGGKQPADVDMFMDWSKRGSPLNKAGNDRAPNNGRLRVSPQ